MENKGLGGIARVLGIVVVVVLIAAAAGYFLIPPRAAGTQTLTIERPAPTVLARLASAPVGTAIAEGVTIAEAATTDGDTVTAPVAFADGATGRVVYTVTPEGEGAQVRIRLEQDLGPNPLDRIKALTGGEVAPLIAAAATAATNDLNALPNASFEGLAYEIVTIEARPFFYVQNCSDTSAESITSIIAQAVEAIPPVMRRNGLQQAGPLMAIEPRVVSGQYCYQVGYPYTGREPRALLIGQVGTTPGGQALRMVYPGSEETVLEDIYNRMDALLAAAHLDNPATPDDDWTTYEVYLDDPTQPGGSRNREIYYVVQGDITALTRIAPPTTPAAAPPATPVAATTDQPAAAAPATTEAPAPDAPAPAAPATTTTP